MLYYFLEFWAVNEIRACIGGRASELACVPVSCVSLPPASACTATRLSRFANAAPLPLFVVPCFAPVRYLRAGCAVSCCGLLLCLYALCSVPAAGWLVAAYTWVSPQLASLPSSLKAA